MEATIVFFDRQDAEALAAVLTEAVADPSAPVDHETAKGALAQIGRAIGRGAAFVSPDLTGPERASAGRCWQALAGGRQGIDDAQFKRVRSKLS
jgi:hypothetical protein